MILAINVYRNLSVSSSLVEMFYQFNPYIMLPFELPDVAAIVIYHSTSFDIYCPKILSTF